jgi:hypothetical protein
MPEELKLFLYGEGDSPVQNYRVRCLWDELNKLSYFHKHHGCFAPKVYEAMKEYWISRILKEASNKDSTFANDFIKAAELFRQPKTHTPTGCIANAYLELAIPDRGKYTGADKFLALPYNSETVRLYAEHLWKQGPGFRREISRQEWSRCIRKLGLTKEYVPRSSGGRGLKASI